MLDVVFASNAAIHADTRRIAQFRAGSRKIRAPAVSRALRPQSRTQLRPKKEPESKPQRILLLADTR